VSRKIHGHNGLDATPLADSGINDRLIKRHSFVNQTFWSSSVSYFVVCYFHHKIFYTTKLLILLCHSLCHSDDAKMINLIRIITNQLGASVFHTVVRWHR